MNADCARLARRRAFGRGLAITVSLALCIAGAATLTRGAAVPLKAKMAQHQLEREFDRQMLTNGRIAQTRAQTIEVPSPQPAALSKLSRPASLGHGTGPIAKLYVERLGVKEFVLSGGRSHEELALGPSMLKQDDGIIPVTVIAGHRDTHFQFIRDLREGDEVELQFAAAQTARYRVIHFETVRWDSFSYPSDPARPLLALATCYPFGGLEYGGPWRRIAWAELVV